MRPWFKKIRRVPFSAGLAIALALSIAALAWDIYRTWPNPSSNDTFTSLITAAVAIAGMMLENHLERSRRNLAEREQMAIVAKWLSLQWQYDEAIERGEATPAQREALNECALSIALWLPDEEYRKFVKRLKEERNPLTALLGVREYLHQHEPGDGQRWNTLTTDDLFWYRSIAETKAARQGKA